MFAPSFIVQRPLRDTLAATVYTKRGPAPSAEATSLNDTMPASYASCGCSALFCGWKVIITGATSSFEPANLGHSYLGLGRHSCPASLNDIPAPIPESEQEDSRPGCSLSDGLQGLFGVEWKRACKHTWDTQRSLHSTSALLYFWAISRFHR
ncbi:hypothetical protein BDN72DRAFT_838460 [Pluteus cervinus]|uniref:Uncharacterized protein n=1 Tax=Pluteus cervinus TaxID=181527 RepID=A0ACD3AYB0_9AGAR|nr:hypothetical protein BDN72DRAFT_838460 [Pluteus cervinus]